MTELEFLAEYPLISMTGRDALYAGVSRETSTQHPEGWELLEFYGIEVNHERKEWRLTELMIEESAYYNASFLNSKGGARATFALLCPCATAPSDDPAIYERQKSLGAWIFRDNIGYDGYALSTYNVGAEVSITKEEIPTMVHVTATALSSISSHSEISGSDFLFGSPFGVPTQEVTSERIGSKVIVAYAKNIAHLVGGNCVHLFDPNIEELFADMPITVSAMASGYAQVSEGQYVEIDPAKAEHYFVRSLEALMLSLEFPGYHIHHDETAEQKIYLGSACASYDLTKILTYEQTGEASTAATDIVIPESKPEYDGLYQIKSPLQHSTGVGRISDLLLPVLPE